MTVISMPQATSTGARQNDAREYADDLTDLVASNRGWDSGPLQPVYTAIARMDTDDPDSWDVLAQITDQTGLPNAHKLAAVWVAVGHEVRSGGPMGTVEFLQGWVEGMSKDAIGLGAVVSDAAKTVGAAAKTASKYPWLVGGIGAALLALYFTRK